MLHEAWLLGESLMEAVVAFRTPLTIMQKFSPAGELGVVALFRKGDSASGEGMEGQFALAVAEFRDQAKHDAKTQALMDFLWGVWGGTFDDEIMDLCSQELQGPPTAFLWHRFLQDSNTGLGAKHRAFTAACTAGPIPAASSAEVVFGASELGEADQEDLKKVAETLKTLRRRTVAFHALPAVGGASGADFTQAQLLKAWDGMRLGHKYARKKGDVRAFILSSELFPPNVAKHGTTTSISEPVPVDKERMIRVIDFIVQKRGKDDLILFFDGRSRSCRKVMEQYEEKLAASGAHSVTECWIVYVQPGKGDDPRVPGRQTSFANNTKEVVMCTLPTKTGCAKLVPRAEFNTCGEDWTSATTYTGVPMRRYSELPRMDCDTKARIVGASAGSAAVLGMRVQKDIDKKGHPFSHSEVKPLNLWQRICEHHRVTHIVDFSPGSAALAIAAAGAMEYEGLAANEVHRDWLDATLDRCVLYLAGQDKGFAKQLGGDDEFMEKVGKYFAGTMMEARRMLGPPEDASKDEDGDDDADADNGESSEAGA